MEKEKHEKTVKQLQGFWIDFAKKQQLRSQGKPERGCDNIVNNQDFSDSRSCAVSKPPELSQPEDDEVFVQEKSNANLANRIEPVIILKSETSNNQNNLLIPKHRK